MNPHKRAAYLKKAALKAARKAIKRRNGEPLTREELLALPVSTMPLWLRLVLAVLGTTIFVGGLFALVRLESSIPAIILIPLGLGLFCVSQIGWRPPLQKGLNSLGTDLAAGVLFEILKSLD